MMIPATKKSSRARRGEHESEEQQFPTVERGESMNEQRNERNTPANEATNETDERTEQRA